MSRPTISNADRVCGAHANINSYRCSGAKPVELEHQYPLERVEHAKPPPDPSRVFHTLNRVLLRIYTFRFAPCVAIDIAVCYAHFPNFADHRPCSINSLNFPLISFLTLRNTSMSPDSAGSSKLQWMRFVLPGKMGQFSFALSQTVMT